MEVLSRRRKNPRDIDIVTFLDYEVFEKREDKVLDKFWSFSLEDEGIDSYLVEDYPVGHKDYNETIRVKKKRNIVYTEGRKQVPQKGYLKIVFQK